MNNVHEQNTALARVLHELYVDLVTLGFTGDIYIDDEEVVSIWENKLFIYEDVEVASFTEETAGQVLIAFQAYCAEHPRTIPHIIPSVSGEDAWLLVREHFEGNDHVPHLHVHPVSLSSQVGHITDNDPSFYEQDAWKCWYIEMRTDSIENEEVVRPETFYIAVPLPTPHIIR